MNDLGILCIIVFRYRNDRVEPIEFKLEPIQSKVRWYEKSSVKDVACTIASSVAMKAVKESNRVSVSIENPFAYKCVALRAGNDVYTAITCQNYPEYDIFRILETFSKDRTLPTDWFEKPKISRIEDRLADVTYAMHDVIEKVRIRGEAIADLHEKSQILDETSTKFYRNARKLNSCCPSLF